MHSFIDLIDRFMAKTGLPRAAFAIVAAYMLLLFATASYLASISGWSWNLAWIPGLVCSLVAGGIAFVGLGSWHDIWTDDDHSHLVQGLTILAMFVAAVGLGVAAATALLAAEHRHHLNGLWQASVLFIIISIWGVVSFTAWMFWIAVPVGHNQHR